MPFNQWSNQEPKESSASVGGRWVVVVTIEQRMGSFCRGSAAVEYRREPRNYTGRRGNGRRQPSDIPRFR